MNKLKALYAAAAVSATAVAVPAHAALPDGVTTAIGDAQTDGVALAGLVLAVIIAIAAFKYIRRAL